MEPTMITNTREMTTGDLHAGDCFRDKSAEGCVEFFVWLGWGKYLAVYTDGDVTGPFENNASTPVTLVDVEFEAEPLDTERTLPVVEVNGMFTFEGHVGDVITSKCDRGDGRFTRVTWLAHGAAGADLPQTTPVTVRKPATYDSLDDVSVSDVVLRSERPGIVVRTGDQPCMIVPGHEVPQNFHTVDSLVRARLTSVNWTRKPEITR